MKTYRTLDLGGIGQQEISVVVVREVCVNKCDSSLCLRMAMDCVAIIITNGKKRYALDIDGKEIPIDQIPH